MLLRILSVLYLLLIHCSTLEAQHTLHFNYKWQECEPSAARFYRIINRTDSGNYNCRDYYIREERVEKTGTFKDATCTIKEGRFTYFHSNGNIRSKGSYHNNLKDGLWLSYYSDKKTEDSAIYNNGKIVSARSWHRNGVVRDSVHFNDDGSGIEYSWFNNGNVSAIKTYTSGSKADGKWSYYHKNGNISCIEQYGNQILRSRQNYSERGTLLNDTSKLSQNPQYKGGPKAWQKYLQHKIYFPEGFKIAKAESAVVVVRFLVTEDGKVQDPEILVPLAKAFDQIAERAVMNSGPWLPAINNNRKVAMQLTLPITFSNSDHEFNYE